MSTLVFPTLPGLSWNIARIPEFHTRIQKAVSGREIRLAFMSSPMVTFKLSYEVLRQDATYSELKTLCSFFLTMKGSFDSFLFDDPMDNAVTNQAIGTGNGSNKAFQLVRTYGSGTTAFAEAVANPKSGYVVKVGGVTQSGYTIDANGVVTLATAPANGAAVTWTGGYYYRVRFNQDVSEFNQFMNALFELKKLELYGSLSNKV